MICCGLLHPFAQAGEPKVLNNLITELVNLKSISAKPAYQEYILTCYRDALGTVNNLEPLGVLVE